MEKPTNVMLHDWFTYCTPAEGQAVRLAAIHVAFHNLACFCVDNTPASEEQAAALMRLREAMMLFDASIVLH